MTKGVGICAGPFFQPAWRDPQFSCFSPLLKKHLFSFQNIQ
jgi:hypothetical protein